MKKPVVPTSLGQTSGVLSCLPNQYTPAPPSFKKPRRDACGGLVYCLAQGPGFNSQPRCTHHAQVLSFLFQDSRVSVPLSGTQLSHHSFSVGPTKLGPAALPWGPEFCTSLDSRDLVPCPLDLETHELRLNLLPGSHKNRSLSPATGAGPAVAVLCCDLRELLPAYRPAPLDTPRG